MSEVQLPSGVGGMVSQVGDKENAAGFSDFKTPSRRHRLALGNITNKTPLSTRGKQSANAGGKQTGLGASSQKKSAGLSTIKRKQVVRTTDQGSTGADVLVQSLTRRADIFADLPPEHFMGETFDEQEASRTEREASEIRRSVRDICHPQAASSSAAAEAPPIRLEKEDVPCEAPGADLGGVDGEDDIDFDEDRFEQMMKQADTAGLLDF